MVATEHNSDFEPVLDRVISQLRDLAPTLERLRTFDDYTLNKLNTEIIALLAQLDQDVAPVLSQTAPITSAANFAANYQEIDNSRLKSKALEAHKDSLSNEQLTAMAMVETDPEVKLLLLNTVKKKDDLTNCFEGLSLIATEAIKQEQEKIAFAASKLLWGAGLSFDGLAHLPNCADDVLNRDSPALQVIALKCVADYRSFAGVEISSGILQSDTSSNELTATLLDHFLTINLSNKEMAPILLEFINKNRGEEPQPQMLVKNLTLAAFLLGSLDRESREIAFWGEPEKLKDNEPEIQDTDTSVENKDLSLRDLASTLATRLEETAKTIVDLHSIASTPDHLEVVMSRLGGIGEEDMLAANTLSPDGNIIAEKFIELEDLALRRRILEYCIDDTSFAATCHLLSHLDDAEELDYVALSLERRTSHKNVANVASEDRELLIRTSRKIIDSMLPEKIVTGFVEKLRNVLRNFDVGLTENFNPPSNLEEIMSNPNNYSLVWWSSNRIQTKRDSAKVLEKTKNDIVAYIALKRLGNAVLDFDRVRDRNDKYEINTFVQETILTFLSAQKRFVSDRTKNFAIELYVKHQGNTDKIPETRSRLGGWLKFFGF